MYKNFYLLLLSAFITTSVYAQRPPEEFFKGLNLMGANNPTAKQQFLIALQKDSTFYGTYHFLGVIASTDNKLDSAIVYFKKSISLNTDNVNHTKEMAISRIMSAYTYQKNYDAAFLTGYDAIVAYPENREIATKLKDACLWSFYTKYNQLDPSYLSPNLREDYVVNSISEEYLILRTIRINDEPLLVINQALTQEKNAPYDVFSCESAKSKTPIKVKFKINWDMAKYFGGKTALTAPVIAGLNNPAHERAGAMLVADSKLDLRSTLEKLIAK